MTNDTRMPPRYGFDLNGYAKQMHDGYWTPWHIAKDTITALRAEVERQRQQLAYLGGTVEVLSLSEQKLNAQLSARDAEVRALREVLQHIRSERRKLTRVFLNTLYRTFGLLDQDNNPTPLLTGEPGPGGEG